MQLGFTQCHLDDGVKTGCHEAYVVYFTEKIQGPRLVRTNVTWNKGKNCAEEKFSTFFSVGCCYKEHFMEKNVIFLPPRPMRLGMTGAITEDEKILFLSILSIGGATETRIMLVRITRLSGFRKYFTFLFMKVSRKKIAEKSKEAGEYFSHQCIVAHPQHAEWLPVA